MNITAKTRTDTVATPTAVCFSRRDFSDPDPDDVVVFVFAGVDDIVVVGVVVVGVVVVVVVVVVGDVAAGDESDGIDSVVERSVDDSIFDDVEVLLDLVEPIGSDVKVILVFT